MHTCVSLYVCVYEERERISVTLVTTAAQGCVSDLCMCARACVLMIKSFICTEGGKHNRTPTQAHTSRYSRHLRHALENVGRHRRYAPPRKFQCTSFRGAGACADERRTGVVAAEAAAAKGHRPRYGRARDGSLVVQCAPLLGTDRRALQLVVVQLKLPVSRRKRELVNQLSGILRKANKQKTNICIHIYASTSMHVCMYDCLNTQTHKR